jgi:hypothetical protein
MRSAFGSTEPGAAIPTFETGLPLQFRVRGLIWRLDRGPEDGDVMEMPLGPHYRHMNIEKPADDFPDVFVLYKFKNNVVTLEEIHLR